MFRSTKTYGHEVGLSVCFRQHRAQSHCRLLHGYALSFVFTFEAADLDAYNWVIDFGGLGTLKDTLKQYFDHKLVVGEDDPMLDHFRHLENLGLADLVIMTRVGCEAFAMLGAQFAHQMLLGTKQTQRVRVISCEVKEHGANSALFFPPIGYYDEPLPDRKFFGQQENTNVV